MGCAPTKKGEGFPAFVEALLLCQCENAKLAAMYNSSRICSMNSSVIPTAFSPSTFLHRSSESIEKAPLLAWRGICLRRSQSQQRGFEKQKQMLYANPKNTTTTFRRKPQSGIRFYCFGVLCSCYLIVVFILGNEKYFGKLSFI